MHRIGTKQADFMVFAVIFLSFLPKPTVEPNPPAAPNLAEAPNASFLPIPPPVLDLEAENRSEILCHQARLLFPLSYSAALCMFSLF